MISRRSLFACLLCLLLAASIKTWSAQHRDACTAFLDGQRTAPATAIVETGTRSLDVPCGLWLPRQPVAVQALCLVDVAFGVVFFVSLWSDWKRRL